MAFTANERTVSELFQAAFARQVSSMDALTGWVNRYEAKIAAGSTESAAMQSILGEMGSSAESQAVYGPLDDAGTVDFIFTNSLGRTAVEPGRTSWIERAATISLEQLQNEILASARTNDDFVYMNDQVNQAEAALGGTGPDVAFTLTVDPDTASANVFNAPRDWNPNGSDFLNTLNDDDVLTGTGTNPTLNMTFVNDTESGDLSVMPSMTGIQTVNVKFTADANQTLDLQDTTGVQELNAMRIDDFVNPAVGGVVPPSIVTFDNIQSVLTKATVSSSNDNTTIDMVFDHSATALSGTSDEVALELTDVQMDDLRIDGVTQGYETINLSSVDGANTLNTLTIESVQALNIDGAGSMRLGAMGRTLNGTLVEAFTYAAGLVNAAGSLTTVDASNLAGSLTYHIGTELNAAADADGSPVALSITGGDADDTFVLVNGSSIDAVAGNTDTIAGGGGTNSLIITGANAPTGQIIAATTAPNLTDIQSLQIRTGQDQEFLVGGIGVAVADAVTVDMDAFDALETILVRNEGQVLDQRATTLGAPLSVSAAEAATINLNDLTVAQAAGITYVGGTTGNNSIAGTTVVTDVKTNTAADLLGITIESGINTDARINFTLQDTAATSFESITLTDNDAKSNSIELNSDVNQTGTITISGGTAGTFINLDVDTAGADVTAVITGTVSDGAPSPIQQGLFGLDTDGSTDTDFARTSWSSGNIADVAALGTEVRLGAATIDASAAASDVVVRVDTNAASTTGAQAITTGSGNDAVIFDFINDARAGLTISDTVNGGDGNDTLLIDGHGVKINLGASEWTNVSNFETIRLVGNGVATASTLAGQNSYNLTLTNDLISSNGTANLLAIVNDNDTNNDTASGVNTATTGAESGVTIDARTLDAAHHFSYNGEENGGVTTDKFIFSDANINGQNIIDGGATDNLDTTWLRNADVMEVRNAGTVTVGDLANISNVGTIAGTNDQAVAQVLTLELNDTVVDAMVDSFHTSSASQFEVLNIQMNNGSDITGAVARAQLNLNASALTTKSQLLVNLDVTTAGPNIGQEDVIQLGHNLTTVNNFDNSNAATPATGVGDSIKISLSDFGMNVAGSVLESYNTGLETGVGGVGGAAGTAAATVYTDSDAAGNIWVMYDATGNTAPLVPNSDGDAVAVGFISFGIPAPATTVATIYTNIVGGNTEIWYDATGTGVSGIADAVQIGLLNGVAATMENLQVAAGSGIDIIA